MRELKFRVWDGKYMEQVCELAWTVGGLRWSGPGVGDGCIPKDNHIIMQFTGLKDKDGEDVYEGDIVEIWSDYGSRKHRIEQVIYTENSASFDTEWVDDWLTCTFEVIGNIYQNPELLETK